MGYEHSFFLAMRSFSFCLLLSHPSADISYLSWGVSFNPYNFHPKPHYAQIYHCICPLQILLHFLNPQGFWLSFLLEKEICLPASLLPCFWYGHKTVLFFFVLIEMLPIFSLWIIIICLHVFSVYYTSIIDIQNFPFYKTISGTQWL